MLKKLHHALLFATLAAVGSLCPAAAFADAADDYFADGNRLFRDDLYWAALLRYSQAAEEGMDTPLLHYNIGVTHYRAGQHIRARQSLLRALSDPELRDAVHYNLGLNAYAQGDEDDALQWFRQVRDRSSNETLRTYAVVAIARIRDKQAEPDDFEIRVVEREKKREFTDLELRVRIGYGQDDNIFRSPDQPYVDFNDPTLPLIAPEVKTGAFVPVSLSAKYTINSLPFEGFYVAYRLGGRYYEDKELENGNEYQHEASFGSEYRRKVESRERELYSAFKVAQHDETYYDPDNGNSRQIGGVVIEDRLDYLRYGPEFAVRQSHERLAIGARLKAQLWNYEEISVVPAYDHEYFYLSLYGQYKFASNSLFRITAEGYSRRFGDRPSYDLDGEPRFGNPNIRYDYYSLQLTARQRLWDSLWFGFDIERTERIDAYVGYNDYTRDSVGFEMHWDPGTRFEFEASGHYYLYDFPRAFAFHNPAAGPKTQESAEISVIGTFRMTRHLYLVGEARYRETVSNDTRIQFERNQFVLGVRWEQ